MKTRKGPRGRRIGATRRAKLLAMFDRSGLSAADFARQHGVRYTTFCGWRYRRPKAERKPKFVEIELTQAAAPRPVLVIELGCKARLHLSSDAQIPLAVRLLQTLNTPATC